MSYAIKVIWKDGEEEYTRDGAEPGGRISRFLTKREAEEQAEFLGMGISGDCQSINVVRYPKGEK